MREDYQHIYLESTSHPLAITQEAYEQIVAIAQAHRICTICLNHYTDTNPCVAENVCLACFQKHRTTDPTHLTFLGEVASDYAKRYGYQVFTFMDAQGYVYIRNNHQKLNDSMQQDMHATLRHYGFVIPTRYTLKGGKEVDLLPHHWLSIYGDFTTSPVVLARYHEYYGDHIDTAFLLYHDREALELSKQKNPTRQWYRETKAAIEPTYQPNRGYLVGIGLDGEDRFSYHLEDYHLYPGIVERAAAAYKQKQ